MSELAIVHYARPVCLNEERKLSRYARSASTDEWRGAFTLLTRHAFGRSEVQPMTQARIIVTHHRPDGRSMPDVGACIPSAKAAIDGIVDAGLLIDDGPAYLLELTFRQPIISGRHALEVLVIEADA